MKITRIYVAGYRLDVDLTRSCVASIRKWYPDIKISLIKDELAGAYDTSDLEDYYGVEVFEGPARRYGWGMSKLEPLFLPDRERFLILDSDIVFAGPVLERLERSGHDFIVADECHPLEEIHRHYFDPKVVEQREPGFRFPGYVFNSGQFVATSGLLRREDFLPFVRFVEPREALQPEIFFVEQGVLSFLLPFKAQKGELTIERQAFMQWAGRMQPEDVEIPRLEQGAYDFLVHWAGPKTSRSTIRMRYLLDYFERAYYRGFSRGRMLRPIHKLQRRWDDLRQRA